MTFEHPTPEHIPQLLKLWKEVFGAWNGFWEMFLETGFSPDRCRCVVEQGRITAALTWLDCSCKGQKMAYVYAVMTHPDHRGRGLCRKLLADVHGVLEQKGYAAALLVPAEEALRDMYGKLGYRTCTWTTELEAESGDTGVSLRAIGPGEYAALRRRYLPPLSVLQEGENLDFLARQVQFYVGNGFLLAAYSDEESLTAPELLGDPGAAPGILRALGCKKGSFRCPGSQIPFAMIHPLRSDAVIPEYFGFAFD